MKDNKPSELLAEKLTEIRLLQAGIKHCKPAFDQEGADLIIVKSITDKHTEIIKVQCKYRKVTNQQHNNIVIPISYVTENFLLFLYISDENNNETLFTFFPEDIVTWNKVQTGYSLALTISKIAQFEKFVYSSNVAARIKTLLNNQRIKEYTSIIIDGIFLEKAIISTENCYRKIYPTKVFRKPKLEEIVEQMLTQYNRFPKSNFRINCLIYDSKHHNLASKIDMPHSHHFKSSNIHQTTYTIDKTDEIVSIQIIEQLERIKNSENILLVANDNIYEKPLIDLQNNNVDIILITLKSDQGGKIFAGTKWGDIMYPIAIALGLNLNEI